MSSTPPYRYITGQELADIIKSDKKPHKDFAVVDVRDDDFLGGNIVGCIRSPSRHFDGSLNELYEQTKDVPKVIFHCALSQERGPKAARKYAERCATDSTNTEKEILVLRGGFTEFQASFKDDPALVEKWRKEVWGKPWY